MAYSKFGLKGLYCTIHPENELSIKVAERFGFVKTGEYIKKYNGKKCRIIFMFWKIEYSFRNE